MEAVGVWHSIPCHVRVSIYVYQLWTLTSPSLPGAQTYKTEAVQVESTPRGSMHTIVHDRRICLVQTVCQDLFPSRNIIPYYSPGGISRHPLLLTPPPNRFPLTPSFTDIIPFGIGIRPTWLCLALFRASKSFIYLRYPLMWTFNFQKRSRAFLPRLAFQLHI